MPPNQAVIAASIEPKPPWAPQQSAAEPEPTPLQIPAVVMNPIPIEVLKELRSGHERFLSVLGCADSRVPVELLFDTGFGDLFVVRNAGTMSTTAAIASLEYAVAHLAVPAIVVLGHQRCGAVEAAFHPELQLTPSLAQVVGQLRMELFGLGAAEDLEEACRLHALNAARNLVDSSVLLTDRLREGRLQVEAAYYNLHTTRIDWLGSVLPNRFSC
jgi:carbonic anhydrase